MSSFDKFTNEELQLAIDNSYTWAECLRRLNIKSGHNKMVPLLKVTLNKRNLSYDKFDEYYKIERRQWTDEEVFSYNELISHSVVRERFKKIKEIPYECAICKLPPFWNNMPLVLTLDHIDGNNKNHELSNLRWICPNCDRQQPTYAGKNKPRTNSKECLYKNTSKICPNCGRPKDYRAVYCRYCRNELDGKNVKCEADILRPNREQLKSLIRTESFEEIGRRFGGVSSNAVKKWCKSFNLPYKKSDIKKISDKEWELI